METDTLKNHPHTIKYTVDGANHTTQEHTLTPIQIMAEAGIDPDKHYLVQIEGRIHESYKEKPAEAIHMHENMKFITIATGPTTVS